MMNRLVLSIAALFWLSTLAPLCMAQDVLSVIHLSADEAAKARQAAEKFRSARDRDNQAKT